jgi:hypothetical protein
VLEAWLLTPLVLVLLTAGAGLGVRRLSGCPAALAPICGFAALVLYGWVAARIEPDAIVPGSVALAVGGGLAGLRTAPAPPVGAVTAALAAFALFAAPIVLSGEATIAGYIKLDDTATWLAITDRVMDAGPTAEGLSPSTYEAALAVNFAHGYPFGGFVPLGVVSELTGVDVAWAFQPYTAVLGAMMAPALWLLAAPLARAPWARWACAVLASQAALLVGFYLWGGIKEVAMATVAASACALVAALPPGTVGMRALLPLGLVAAAAVPVGSPGALVWLLPAAALLAVRLVRTRPSRGGIALGAAVAAALGAAILLPGRHLSLGRDSFSDQDDVGNLGDALDPLQVAGVWPASDFRLEAAAETLVVLAVAALATAALAAVVVLARGRQWPAVGFTVGVAAVCLAVCAVGSPWLDAKAMAIASPAVLFAALLGLGLLRTGLLRIVALGMAAGLVIWSAVAQWGGASLAPREQLAELEEIGDAVAGEGPTLMTEYSPYGARHFLREADPEAVSELRRRPIPRRDGQRVRKGDSIDTDLLDPAALGVYRTLVLRRSPAQSRPPAPYELVWRGDFYEAWRRPASADALPERLALGSRFDPVARPACADVLALARRAGELVAATRPDPVVVPLGGATYPDGWRLEPGARTLVPRGAGSIAAEVHLPGPGDYEIWLGGSVRPRVELLLDGEPAGEVRHELNNRGGYVSFGAADLAAGDHEVELRFGAADLHPGSGGPGLPVGPIVLTRAEAADSRLVRVESGRARELCGREWDWIEAAA